MNGNYLDEIRLMTAQPVQLLTSNGGIMKEFEREVADRIGANGARHTPAGRRRRRFMTASIAAKYSYNFSWLGRPIIQYPQDIVAMQELIWSLKPDLIIETGIAHGGSLIFSAPPCSIAGYGDARSGTARPEGLAPRPRHRHRHPRPQPRRHRGPSHGFRASG